MPTKDKPAKSRDLTESFVSDMTRCRPREKNYKEAKKKGGTFDIVMSGDEILGDVRYVLLTGVEPFDQIVGGFPFGRINEVFGLENCGKTATMVRCMCRFQANHIYEVMSREGFVYTVKRVDPKRVQIIKCYVDNEHSLEKGFKITITDAVYNEKGEEKIERTDMNTALMMCDTVDQIFHAVDRFMERISAQEAINAEQENDKIVFGVFIVDTIASTSSREELARDWGERDYPRQAQQISSAFRRLTNEISRHNVALICTNQVRTKFKDLQKGHGYKARFNTPQADDFSTLGGKALAFYATHRVFMFQIPIKYTLVQGAQFPAGYLIGFRTVKNRLRKPGREGRMVLLFDEDVGGLHNSFSILESMIWLKVAEMHDGGSVSFKFRKFGIATTSFAENVVLTEPAEAEDAKSKAKRKKRPEDPEIEGRYEWLSFYRAHRNDLNQLWLAAMRRAYETEGLDEFYKPDRDDAEEGEGEEYEADLKPPPRRVGPLPGIADEDL